MNIAVHQPYFIPYLPYFQGIASSDCFVLHHTQYTPQSFINRNKIWVEDKVDWVTIPVQKCSVSTPINEVKIAKDFNYRKFIKRIESSYRGSPYYEETMNLLFPEYNDIDLQPDANLFKVLDYQIHMICGYLDQDLGKIVRDYDLPPGLSFLKGQNKVLRLCRELSKWSPEDKVTYINAAGGRALYDKDVFESKGFELKFIKPFTPEYKDFKGRTCPGLSILDVLMNNPREKVVEWVNQYQLEG